jgi:hypothetical protein
MWPQSSLCSIIGWIHTWIKNERKPVVKAVVDLSNEFPWLSGIAKGLVTPLCPTFWPGFPLSFVS